MLMMTVKQGTTVELEASVNTNGIRVKERLVEALSATLGQDAADVESVVEYLYDMTNEDNPTATTTYSKFSVTFTRMSLSEARQFEEKRKVAVA
jgi:hypothetical protein